MKHLLTLLLILSCIACNDNKRLPKTGQFYDPQEQETGEVFVCTGRRSHAYHSNRKCFGLTSCSKRIIKMTKEKAEGYGRKPCHFCHED